MGLRDIWMAYPHWQHLSDLKSGKPKIIPNLPDIGWRVLDLCSSVQVPLTAGTVNRGSARTPVDFTAFKAGGNANSKSNQGLGGTNHSQELFILRHSVRRGLWEESRKSYGDQSGIHRFHVWRMSIWCEIVCTICLHVFMSTIYYINCNLMSMGILIFWHQL